MKSKKVPVRKRSATAVFTPPAPGGCPNGYSLKVNFVLYAACCLKVSRVNWNTWTPLGTQYRLPCWYNCDIIPDEETTVGTITMIDARCIALQAREGVVKVRARPGSCLVAILEHNIDVLGPGIPAPIDDNGMFVLQPSVGTDGQMSPLSYYVVFAGGTCMLECYDCNFEPGPNPGGKMGVLQKEDGYPPPGAPGAIN